MEMYLLDHNLNKKGVLSNYISYIWVERRLEAGSLEIYFDGSSPDLAMIEEGDVIVRDDTATGFVVTGFERSTDPTAGDHTLVKFEDTKLLLDYRIYPKRTILGNVESELYKQLDVVSTSLIEGIWADMSAGSLISYRSRFRLAPLSGFRDVINTEMELATFYDVIIRMCSNFNWNYKLDVILEDETYYLEYALSKGRNLTKDVEFSQRMSNVRQVTESLPRLLKYTNSYMVCDITTTPGQTGTSALVERVPLTKSDGTPYAQQDMRYLLVKPENIQREVTYMDLTNLYPGGTVVVLSNRKIYRVPNYQGAITPALPLSWWQEYVSGGTVITLDDGLQLYSVNNVEVATMLLEDDVTDNTQMYYTPWVIHAGMRTQLYTALLNSQVKVSVEIDILEDTGFEYRQDYQLGDYVSLVVSGVTYVAQVEECLESVESAKSTQEITLRILS